MSLAFRSIEYAPWLLESIRRMRGFVAHKAGGLLDRVVTGAAVAVLKTGAGAEPAGTVA